MNRLEGILSLIEPCESLVDIGSDHGYLAKMVIDKDLAKKVYVSDVAPGPLSTARENLRDYPVEFLLMDGLKGFDRPVELAVVAGMGGELIARIVEDSLESFKGLRYFLVQPMQHIAHLRRALFQMGFFLEKELLVYEDNFYEILLYTKGEDRAYDFNYSKGLFDDRELYRSYMVEKASRLDYILGATRDTDPSKYKETLRLRRALEEDCRSYGIVL